MTRYDTLNIHYPHLGKVLADKYERKIGGEPTVPKIGISVKTIKPKQK